MAMTKDLKELTSYSKEIFQLKIMILLKNMTSISPEKQV